jgi:hypothetical protein
VGCVIGVVRIPGRGDDAFDQRAETSQQPPRLRLAAEEAEVVALHDNGIEAAELRPDFLERQHASIVDATPPRYVDGERGDVDRDHLVPTRLNFKRDAARPATSVEDTPAYENAAVAVRRTASGGPGRSSRLGHRSPR